MAAPRQHVRARMSPSSAFRPPTWRTRRRTRRPAAVIVGAPYDGGTSHRPGARFGPQAIRLTDYLPHDGRRPHLALGVDPLVDLGVVDVGDVEMPPGEIEASMARLEAAVLQVASTGALPVILGGDHTIAWPDVTGRGPPRRLGAGVGHPFRRPRGHRGHPVRVVDRSRHADAAPDRVGGGPRRPFPADRACGATGPSPPTLAWMADQGMRSFEMSEVVARGLDACLIGGHGDRHGRLRRRVSVGGRRRGGPGRGAGNGHARAGGPSAPASCSTPSAASPWRCRSAGMDVVEVSPPYDHAEITAYLGNRVVLEALSGVAWRRRQAAGHRDSAAARAGVAAARPARSRG